MKKILYLFMAAALIASVSSCKKCFNCTYSECTRCDIPGNSFVVICKSENPTTYEPFKANCLA